MASIRFELTNQQRLTLPNQDDATVATIVRDVHQRFGEDGGLWFEFSDDDGKSGLWWMPSTTIVTAYFDDTQLHHDVADLPLKGSHRDAVVGSTED